MSKKIFITIIILSVILFVISFLGTAFSQNNINFSYSSRLVQRAEKILNKTEFDKKSSLFKFRDNLTMIKLEAKRNWEKLSSDAKKYFQKILQRVDWLKKSYNSASGYFKVWYNTGSDKDAVHPADDINANGVPDMVEYVAGTLDAAYTKYINAGLVMPYPVAENNTHPPFIKTKYEVYLTNSNCGDSYGAVSSEVTLGDNPNSTNIVETNSASSFMELRSSYIDFGDIDGDTAKANEAIRATTAHEFMHSVQMGYNQDMSGFIMEMCATYGESWNYPTVYDNFQYNDEFTRPDVALDYDNSEELTDYDDHWYAAWYYMRYLTDHYGTSLIKTLYEGLLTQDYIPVFNSILQPSGLDFLTSVKNFFIANALMSSKTVCQPYTYNLADAYRGKLSELGSELNYEKNLNYSGTNITHRSNINGNNLLMRLSADYLTINPTQNFSVKVTQNSQSDNLAVVLLKTDALINPNTLSVVNAVKSGNEYTINVTDKSQYSKFILIIINQKTTRNGNSSNYTVLISAASTITTYSISGTVKDNNGNNLSGVTISLTGDSQSSITTTSDGTYSFNNLESGKNYIIIPTKTGYTFSPVSGNFSNLSKNETQNFIGTPDIIKYSISGKVKDNSGNGIANVTVTLSGNVQSSVLTSSDGTYAFNNLESGKSYTVTPVKTGYTFVPVSATFSSLSKNETQDFIGTFSLKTYKIDGYTKNKDNTPLRDVIVNMSGGKSLSFKTGVDGYFLFENLEADKSYTITPVLGQVEFDPLNKTFTNLGNNQTVTFISKTLLGISGFERLPDDIKLYSNYPNPFNPSTRIRYELNTTMKIKLQVFNALGKLVSTLFEGIQFEGLHEVIFNASDIPSGAYYIKLTTPFVSKNIHINLIK